MSEQQVIHSKELRLVIRLLEKLRDTADHITMTGGLSGGEGYLRLQFDSILSSLTERGIVLPPYLPPLPPDAGAGVVGVAADQLAEYLKELLNPDGEESGESGTFFDRFFGSRDFAHIGDAIREAMPDWMQRAPPGRPGPQPGETPQTTAGAPGAPPGPGEAPSERSDRLKEIGARMQAISDQLSRGDLPSEEYQRLALEMARLGQEHARLTREAAGQQ